MPLAYQLDESSLLRIEASGVFTFAEVLETRDRLLVDPAVRGVVRTLVDLSGVIQFALDPPALRALALSHPELPFVGPGTRMAVVAPTALAYGLARMYELSRSQAPDHVEVFHDREQALHWLRK